MLDLSNSTNIFYEFFFVLNADIRFLPFAWIWLMGLFVTFLLESAVVFSYYFNQKHDYNNIEKKSNFFFMYFIKFLKSKKVNTFLSIAYTIYI